MCERVNGAFFPTHSGITSQVQGLKNGWMGDYVYVIMFLVEFVGECGFAK